MVESLIQLIYFQVELTLLWNVIIEVATIFLSMIENRTMFANIHSKLAPQKLAKGGLGGTRYDKPDLFDKYLCLDDSAENNT